MTEGSSSHNNKNSFNQVFGQAGEDIAERFLLKKGFRLITRQYDTPWGEIDLIMEDGSHLVFVEVKRRSNNRYGEPEEAITVRKMKHMIRSAVAYIVKTGTSNKMARFDIVSIGPSFIRHYPDAFPAGDDFYF